MSNEQDRLQALANDFFAAFNRNDAEGAMAFFADNAFYEDANGVRHDGKAAVGEAFAPLFGGDFGAYQFVTEDMLVDPNTGSVLVRFLCNMAPGGDAMAVWPRRAAAVRAHCGCGIASMRSERVSCLWVPCSRSQPRERQQLHVAT